MAADFSRRLLASVALLIFCQLAQLVQEAGVVRANEAVCAEVRIEIRQKLNLERQAFDAVLRIRNGLATSEIEALAVNVLFTDALGNPIPASADPNQTSARFFVRLDSLEGVDAVDGSGRVAPSSVGVARWLIIPSASAGGTTQAGEVYRVGARVTYRIGGEDRSVDVTPETITVRPQPRLVLDYFLAGDVYSDDPFTPAVEPPEPFTFGVRVRNAGAGVGRRLRIESAQPRIVENLQGLLVDFLILGGRVDDAPASASLRLDLGDIEPGRARMGRWLMQTSLSGQFVDIEATYTHADTLGGALTSLIDGEPSSHLLVGDVLVDLPGRDGVRDFLARDGDVLRVYESNGPDSEVQDLSSAATLTPLGSPGQYAIQLPPTQGLVFARLADPTSGAGATVQATRADGTALPAGNVWRSRTRDANLAWNYFINVFDTRGGGAFTVRTDLPAPASGLSGSVYVDVNGNGTRDPDEPGLAQASLLLDGVAAGAQVQRSTQSQTDGSFEFSELPAGTYALSVAAVDGFADGVHQAGSAGGQVSSNAISGIALGQAQSASGYAFAKRPPPVGPRLADLFVAPLQGPSTATVGDPVNLLLRASNRGPEGALARSLVVLPEAFELASFSALGSQFNPDDGVWTHGSVPAGAEQTLNLSGRFATAGPARISHSVALIDPDISDPNMADNAISLDVLVEPAPGLQLDFALASQSRLLIWSACAAQADPNCSAQRRARWQMALQPHADLLQIAESPADFRRLFRLGEFNAALIDGPLEPLAQLALLDELGEALRRGSALILSGERDARWSALEARGGLGAPNSRPGADALVEFGDSEFFPAGALQVVGPLLTHPSADVRVLARYPDAAAAAIASSRDGVRLMSVGFDLLSYIETAVSSDAAQRVLAGVASVSDTALDAQDRIPLRVSVDRASGAGALDLRVSWPTLLALAGVQPAPTTQTALEARWQRSLTAAELPFEVLLDLRASGGAGMGAVLASATLDADSAADTIELRVLSTADRFAAALAALDAVPTPSAPEQQALARARAGVLAAQATLNADDPWGALAHLLQALRDLDEVTASEARVAQRAVSFLLAAVSPAAAAEQGDSIFANSFEAQP
jgi:hypothetical protein